MLQMWIKIISLLCVLHINGSSSLHATLQAIPPVVTRGQHATLRCLYELEGAPLYAVKWYRGAKEFYRFIPNEIPMKVVFPIPKMHVDLSLSNETQVVLRDLELIIAGNFTCEVSTDAPAFYTVRVTTILDVYVLPESGPVIHTEQTQYGPGDILKAECKIGPSIPPSNLTFIINNQPMTLAPKAIQETEGGLFRSSVSIEIPLVMLHFQTGRLSLRCLAQIQPLYLQAATAAFRILQDPKPERITSSGTSGTSKTPNNMILLLILSLFYALVASSDYMFEDFLYEYPDYSFQDQMSREAITSLLGN